MSQPILRPLLWIGLLLSAPMAMAEYESLERIREAAGTYVQAQYRGIDRGKIGIQVGRLDRRLRLPKCATALQTFASAGKRLGAKQTVGVRCSSGQGWSLYVPVRLSIRKKVLVASREIVRGSTLTADDYQLEERDITPLRKGYLEDPSRLQGKVLKRTLHVNQVITSDQLSARQAIKRGHQVTILAKVGRIKVRMQGKALSDAAIGEHIRVQNSSSKRRIEATVVAPGIVEVSL